LREITTLNNSTVIAVKPRGKPAAKAAPPAVKLSLATIHRLSEVFKILSDKSRLRILLALAQHAEMHVSALCRMLDQSQPAVSHHLTLMRMTGLVGFRRDGKHNFYYLASGFVRDLLEQVFADSNNGQKAFQFDDFVLSYKRSR
jgi:ArsR family transcriptional regulator